MKTLIELAAIAALTFGGVVAVAHDDAKPCSSSPAPSLPAARSVARAR